MEDGTVAHGDSGRPKSLHHHFDTPLQQFDSDKLGMWLFLATEILLFGGLFCAYAVYRSNHPEIFIYASEFLDKKWGAINTIVLILSSFTMAMAVRSAQLSLKRALISFLGLTLFLGFVFLGIKYIEYKEKWVHGLLPGKHYSPTIHAEVAHDESPPPVEIEVESVAVPAADASGDEPVDEESAVLKVEKSLIAPAAIGPPGLAFEVDIQGRLKSPEEEPKNVQQFFSVYFLMTGLHGIHVVAGLIAMIVLMVLSARGRFNREYFTPVELTGLYWHLVDLIWIYLFPLLYLIG